jgi:type VI secretion system protein
LRRKRVYAANRTLQAFIAVPLLRSLDTSLLTGYTLSLGQVASGWRLLRVAILAVAPATFCGCLKVKIICLRTTINPTANQNQPVAVDVVLVRDKDLTKKLMTLSAADWFDKRAQFERDYPDPKELVVYHREWVPNQIIPCSNIPLHHRPRATILFANYYSKGDHRARLVNGKSAYIQLLDDDFKILSMADCNKISCPPEAP